MKRPTAAALLAVAPLIVLGSARGAAAADFFGSALRGSIAPPQAVNNAPWDGVYFGGSAAYSSGDFKPRTSGYSAIAQQLTNDSSLTSSVDLASQLAGRNTSTNEGAYGGFIGYNTTWEDVVLGVEADYQNTSLKYGGTVNVGSQIVDSSGVNHSYSGSSTVGGKITDILTLRGRAGYAYGDALPYVTLGIGVIHGTATARATLRDQGFDTNSPATIVPFDVTYTGGYSNRDKWAVGVAVGAGVDYLLTSSIFVRAEYQYMRFNSFDGTEVNLNNAKVGLAAKF